MGRGHLWIGVLAAVCPFALASCQKATRIGAVNRCGFDVEATATGTRTEESPPFKLLKPGERRELREVGEGRPSVWVGVRLPGRAMPELVSVRVADLTKGANGDKSDFYFEIVDCPT